LKKIDKDGIITGMPKKINYTLTTEQLQQVETAIKNHPNLRVRQRAQMIRLLHLGHKPEEVGDLLCVTGALVYMWHARWRESGLDGLVDKPKSGRPKAGGEEYRQKLAELIETEPQELGYGFNVWTIKRLLAHMEKETKLLVHKNTLLNMLAEQGYVFRRPKHDLGHLQDKQAKETAAEILEELKKKPNEARLNYSLWTKRP
jgi:putative transposase